MRLCYMGVLGTSLRIWVGGCDSALDSSMLRLW